MSYMSEFPYYDGTLYVPHGWEDNSWHNDTCPHVMKRSKDEKIEYRIWQDYVDPDKRERGDACKRYLFQIVVEEIIIFFYETDNLNEIIALAKASEN